MAERNGQAWFEQFKKDHANIVSRVVRFADRHEQSADDKNAFLNKIFTVCYSALIFDGDKEHRQKRANDRAYLVERSGVVMNLEAVINFMKRHGEQDTSLFNTAMFLFATNVEESTAKIRTLGGKQRTSDLMVSILSELKAALCTEEKYFTPSHSHQHGCFLYPSPVNSDRTTTAPRMLAVNLVGLFRLYSSGHANVINETGWPVPRTGKPNHALVTELVQAVFPDSEDIDARSAEADFKKNSPGLLIVPWEPWGK